MTGSKVYHESSFLRSNGEKTNSPVAPLLATTSIWSFNKNNLFDPANINFPLRLLAFTLTGLSIGGCILAISQIISNIIAFHFIAITSILASSMLLATAWPILAGTAGFLALGVCFYFAYEKCGLFSFLDRPPRGPFFSFFSSREKNNPAINATSEERQSLAS